MKRLTTNDFVNRSNVIHNNKYDYSLVNYINARTKVQIICPEHGIFKQNTDSHLRGTGCPACVGLKKLSTKSFIEKSKLLHNNQYTYEKTEYKNSHTKVTITCSIHGDFSQKPYHHLRGVGCPICGGTGKKNTKEFIDNAAKVHNGKYDYDLVNYKNNITKVKIICPNHGVFTQRPNDHLNGSGCNKCSQSVGEMIIYRLLIENNINFTFQKTFEDCKYKAKLKFDFYIPILNICIEYDGKQHYEINNFFGGIKGLQYQQKRDSIKNIYCKENNIKLLRIKYDDDIEKSLYKEKILT